MTRGRGCLASLLVAIVVTACGPEEPSPSPSPTAFVAPTPTVTTYELDTTVWYAGLIMTFGTVTAELDPHGGRVSVQATIENPGSDDRTLAAPIRINAGGGVFEPARETVLPTIGAGQTAATTLAFDVVGIASVGDGVLLIGDPGEHLGVVPFGDQPAAVTLEPIALKLSGRGDAGDLRLVLRSGELRWDLPDWADELPSGSAALTVTYDVTYRGTFSGGFAFTGDNVALRLPDGTVLEARPDGRSQSVALLRKGRTVRRLFTRFEIPAAAAGTFTLLVRDGDKRARIRFTLPG